MKVQHLLYLKANTISNIVHLSKKLLVATITVLSFLLISSCSSFSSKYSSSEQQPTPHNLFNVSGQIVNNDLIRSIHLHKSGNPRSAPFIELGSNDQLLLQFDMLEFDSRQFIATFSHYDKNWVPSSIPPDFYIDGLQQIYLPAGQLNRNNRPTYRHYSFTFPNQQFSFSKSGNYMLQIEDSETGFLIFSLPFFVYENAGDIRSSIETYSGNGDYRVQHSPESRFMIPEFVDQPQFDLDFYYYQNRFWGRPTHANEVDFSSPESIYAKVSQERMFTGDYEFLLLNLDPLSQQNPQIFEYLPAETPPKAILYDDYRGFLTTSNQPIKNRFGDFSNQLHTEYANVLFSLSADIQPDELPEIYLVGDFTNWAIKSSNKLVYNNESERWQTSAIIKKGAYSYKYILFEEGGVNDLYFDDGFIRTEQEYHLLVYYGDNLQFYDRLLQFNEFYSGF